MSENTSQSFRHRALWLLLALSLVITIPALKGDVLLYDDMALLAGDDGALDRSATSFFTETYYYAYLPFYGLSYWADGKLGATVESPLLFHVANVLWHAAACFFLFLVLLRLLGKPGPALIGAALFAVHPLHVESVAWIAGRKEVLSGAFFFLAWLLHLRAEEGSARSRVGSVLCFWIACFAKASAIVLPAVLLCAAWFLPRYEKKRKLATLQALPMLVLALLPLAVHLLVASDKGILSESLATTDRALAAVVSWGGTLLRAIVPVRLSAYYPETVVTDASALMVPGALLAAALILAIALRRRAPWVTFGVAAFFVCLAPFNNVFPATDVLAADRYAYLPLLGIAAIGAWAASQRFAVQVGLGVAVLALASLSFLSAHRFTSDETLWTATIAARPDAPQAHVSRGIIVTDRAMRHQPVDRRELESGVADLRNGLLRARLDAHRAKANAALVLPLIQLGEGDEALERASAALDLASAENADARRFRADVLSRRAIIYKAASLWRYAARDYLAAAKLWSRYRTWMDAGEMALKGGEGKIARMAFERARDLKRDDPEPHVYLAELWRATRQRAEQKRALKEASRIAPANVKVVEAWIEYWLDGKTPNYQEAQKALAHLPADAPDRKRLAAQVEAQRAIFLFRRNRLQDALTAANHARTLGLTGGQVLYDLGHIYVDAGHYDVAVECYRGAGDVLEQRSTYRDAIARAFTLKAYRLLRKKNESGAKRAFRAALDARPELVEAGAAPLRGELAFLRKAGDDDILLLATAVVAGDPALGSKWASRLLDRKPGDERRVEILRLRALLRAFTPPHDFQGAEDDLRLVLAKRKDDLWAHYRLAQVWVRHGVGWIQTGARIKSETRAEQGRNLVLKAEKALSELLLLDPNFHYARLQRGEARFALDDLIGAKADYLALRERGARIKESPLKEAVVHRLEYVRTGEPQNLEAARALLEGHALKMDPNYFDALYELGSVYHHVYDRQDIGRNQRIDGFNRAILWYRRAMALNPRQPGPRIEWARICIKAAREALNARPEPKVKEAHALLVRVEADAPDVVNVWKERVRINLRRDFPKQAGMRLGEAMEGARKALALSAKLAPGDPELRELRALYHRTRGWHFYLRHLQEKDPKAKEIARQAAVKEWKTAFASWPSDPENLRMRDRLRTIAPGELMIDAKMTDEAFREGQAAYKKGEWKKAVYHFSRAVQIVPESVDLRFAYADSLARAGLLDDARSNFERVANHTDGARYPEACYKLGNIYYVRRNLLVARVWYEKFVRLMTAAERGDDPLVLRTKQVLAEISGKK